jgi:hypothetical protein
VVEIECWLCAGAEAADRDEPRRKKDFSLLESLSFFDSGIVRYRNKMESNEGKREKRTSCVKAVCSSQWQAVMRAIIMIR